jgi:sugar transferase (PEP-CTERM/EpsH1 system associated)
MEKVLYLCQRIPFPPDKGDKIPSFNILKFLAQRSDVYLGSFVDDPMDMQYANKVNEYCKDMLLLPLNPKISKLKALPALFTKQPLTNRYFLNSEMTRWVQKTVYESNISKIVIFSSTMAQYVSGTEFVAKSRFANFVDIDSDKWAQYAKMSIGLKRWVYSREAKYLEDFEKRIANEFDATSFVTPFEVEQFRQLVPGLEDKIVLLQNGVNFEYFSPELDFESPFSKKELPIVFTGAMDYFPNADAVVWFAKNVFPIIKTHVPNASFHIVGGKPGGDVQALTHVDSVFVTGRVPDVRPYLKHACIAVAPLRAARGIQNKALEALAMGLQIVCTPEVHRGLRLLTGKAVSVASEANDFAKKACDALNVLDRQAIGRSNRQAVQKEYSWEANLLPLASFLSAA